MFRLPTQKTQPKVEQTEGYLILPIVLGFLKGVLKNDIIAKSANVSVKLESLIKELLNDKNIAYRVMHLDNLAATNGEVKRWNKEIEKAIRELAKKDIKEIVALLKSKDTDVPLSESEYASIVEQAYTVYLFCPTKRQIDIYRKEIENFDDYLSYGRIILISSKDLDFFQKMPSVGYLYSPKDIETSSVNNQKRLKTIAEVQKALDENLPSIKLV